jgi:hypothetical protein
MLISTLDIKEDNMTDNEDDPALDPNTPMGGAVAAGVLRRQAGGSYLAYNSPMPEDTPAPPDLDAIRARLAARTGAQWPWSLHGPRADYEDEYVWCVVDQSAASPYHPVADQLTEGYGIGEICMIIGEGTEADRVFIAAAPTDIATLLAEVDRLRAENRYLSGQEQLDQLGD